MGETRDASMSKLLAVMSMCALVLALSLAGCGKAGPAASESSDAGSAAAAAERGTDEAAAAAEGESDAAATAAKSETGAAATAAESGTDDAATAAESETDATAAPTAPTNPTTDVVRTSEHEPITWDLITLVNHNSELKALLEKAIEQAVAQNPDPQTNPVDSLESFYDFIDWSSLAMPWEINPSKEHVTLYDRIDQSMGCFYFVCDQQLAELEGRGYYNNTLMYHEPFRSWLIKFTSEYGAYLSTEASWCDEYYQNALANSDFKLDGDLYEDPSNWHSFNDFFARKLSDPSKRPIAAPDDASVVTSPADSVPQGVWQIDDDNRVVMEDVSEAGVAIKTGTLTDVSVLLGDSAYAKSFAGGTLTHTFLDVNDYHRYHFPVGGTVREVLVIPGDDAPGGWITWDAATGRYKEHWSDIYGWQSIETRGVVIVELDGGGLVAIVPVGMCEVASVNFEETVTPGAVASKGDSLGYFLFGGSDIVMLFSEDVGFELTAEPDVHLEMGNAYGRIAK